MISLIEKHLFQGKRGVLLLFVLLVTFEFFVDLLHVCADVGAAKQHTSSLDPSISEHELSPMVLYQGGLCHKYWS